MDFFRQLASNNPLRSDGQPNEAQQTLDTKKELRDQFGWYGENGYYFNNNMWGKDAGTGTQVTRIDTAETSGVSWHVDWEWSGGDDNVKSYPYAGRELPEKRLIRDISSIPASTDWKYSGRGVRANVAYDLFTAADPNHENWHGDFELMIWLARLGHVYPLGKIVARVKIEGVKWELFEGWNGKMHVYSFVAPKEIKKIDFDIKVFFDHLIANNGYPHESQHLITFQFGTEPFTGGPATFKVKNWSGEVH